MSDFDIKNPRRGQMLLHNGQKFVNKPRGPKFTYDEYDGLTNDGMADALHRHSELSASDGAPNPALQVDAAGNVGIGIAAPVNILNIYQDDRPRIYLHDDTTGTTNADGSYIGLSADQDFNIWNLENTDIRFATNNTERMDIDADGLKPINNATIHAIAQTGAPTSTVAGALWLDTDDGVNGTLKCYANGTWRTVSAL